jgi:hypothetical protein
LRRIRFRDQAWKNIAANNRSRDGVAFEEAVMNGFAKSALVVAALCALSLGTAAYAVDRGQFDNVPPDVRAWFKSMKSPKGVPCCDVSDGHRTDYDMRDGAFWVPIEGEWMRVPDDAIIRDAGNPVGEAIVWYVHHRGAIVISCFVPGGGA